MIITKDSDINPTLIQEEVLTEAEAENKISFLFQTMCQFGAISDEKNQIDNIIRDMKSGAITPEKAVEKATNLLNNKNGFLTQYR